MPVTPKKGAATQPKAAAKPAAARKTIASRKGPVAQPVTAARKEGPGAGDLLARFESAAASAKQTKHRPDNATMLKLYSYYKQATVGDVQGARPGGFDFVGAAKYDAWAKLAGTARDDAMTGYIRQVERLNRE